MPYNRLSTSKIAQAAGCHPNTVRLYEAIGFIAPVARSPHGYRLYTPAHVDQMCLARLAMSGTWPGPNIRHSLIDLVHSVASQDYGAALKQAYRHLEIVESEQQQAEAAVDFLHRWVNGELIEDIGAPLLIHQAAQLLNITVDALRNWDRSGLVNVPRSPTNHYRQYRAAEIGRVRVIRLLRQSGYSPMAILRMLVRLDQDEDLRTRGDLRRVLDTPRPDEDVYFAADHWISTLAEHNQRAHELIARVESMLQKYG